MLKVLSLFSGIGAFERALEKLGVEHEVVAYCEIDKYASKAYSIIHGIPESKNLKDVTKVDILDIEDSVDLITYGFPCQDISNAGKQKGFTDEEGNRTRSGLFFEALRIIDDYRPKFAIAENVKALTSKKFTEEFKIVLDSLDEVGYNNYWAVLNAKDYGIPQNRERVFIISIRKDIDRGFTFPGAIPLTQRLKDLLEDEVDESFYLSDYAMRNFNLFPEIKGTDLKVAGSMNPNKVCQDRTRVLSDTGISQGLRATDYKDPPKILAVREATIKGYSEAHPGDSVNLEHPNSKTRRGRVGQGVAQTLTTSCNQAVVIDSPKIERVGIIGSKDYQTSRVYSQDGLSPCLDTGTGGNHTPKIVENLNADDIEAFLND